MICLFYLVSYNENEIGDDPYYDRDTLFIYFYSFIHIRGKILVRCI